MRRWLEQVWRAILARPVPVGTNAALAWTGFVLGVLTPVVLLPPLPALLKFLVVLGFACLAPGAALVAHVRLGNAVAAWAMAFVLSLSLFALVAAVLVWTARWYPFWALVGFAVLSAGSSLVALAPFLAGRGLLPDGPRAGPAVPGQRLPDPSSAAFAPSAETTQVIPRTLAVPTGESRRIWTEDVSTTQVIAMPSAGGAPVTGTGRRGLTERAVELTRWIPRVREPVLEERKPVTHAVPVPPPAPPTVLGVVAVVFGPAFLASTLLYWLASLQTSHLAGAGDYGLLGAMHPTYYLAIALCAFGFLVEIARGARRTWLLVAHIVVLILILHATVPLLLPEPEYAWTYKHIGVIELFKARGGIVDVTDIYQAWPTFFAATAQLSALSGLSPVRIAAWAPVFFDAAAALPLFAIVRSLTDDRRMPYLTVFLFLSVNWVAQDYLSPQAFAYVLCLGAVLIMLRWLRRVPGKATVRPRWLGRLWTWLHQGLAEVPYVSRRAERAALAGLYLVYLVVVISHQLSPYLVALSATALVALGLVRSWRIVPILLGLCAVYLLPHYDVVDHYGLFNGFNIFNTFLHSTQGVASGGVGTVGRARSVQVVQTLSVLVWGLAALSTLTSREKLGPVAVPATLAFAPFAILFGQGYGGEAIYRVYLFSVPWCAYLIANLFLRVPRVPRPVGVVGVTVLLAAATCASLQGAHGQLSFDEFAPDEVAAVRYAYEHAPPGSHLLTPDTNLPSRLTANYGDVLGPIDLTKFLPQERSYVTDDDIAALSNSAADSGKPTYLIITHSMVTYAHYFGYLPDGLLDNLNAALARSPDWKAEFRGPDAVVYRFVGAT